MSVSAARAVALPRVSRPPSTFTLEIALATLPSVAVPGPDFTKKKPGGTFIEPERVRLVAALRTFRVLNKPVMPKPTAVEVGPPYSRVPPSRVKTKPELGETAER